MRPAPAHVNQFAARGRFPNGNDSTPYDCMVAAGVMDLDAATAGRIRLTTTQLRARQSDQDKNGIGLNDVAKAHVNTPGAPALSYGRKGWPAIASRLQAADGAIIAGYYIALGSDRASGFRGAHALYAQRIQGVAALINDPLRNGPAWISTSSLQRFYLSGLAQAGWSTGSAVSTPGARAVSTPGPAWLTDNAHVLTEPDLRAFKDWILANMTGPTTTMAQYLDRLFFPNPLSQIGAKNYVGRTVGELRQDAPGLFKPANDATFGSIDPLAALGSIGPAIAGIPAALGEVARNGILLVAILGLVIMGLWLVATAPDNPLPKIGA